jgi:6-pyruvoyltetrahydropterin/6-carboxytetrahydropterin synthase
MPRWTLRKSFSFDSAHQLVFYDGKCSHLHGHTYKITIEVTGTSLQQSGPHVNMLLDYTVIGQAVKSILELCDHRHLNDVLQCTSPTSEFMAETFFKTLEQHIPGLSAVEVNETPSTCCRYEP